MHQVRAIDIKRTGMAHREISGKEDYWKLRYEGDLTVSMNATRAKVAAARFTSVLSGAALQALQPYLRQILYGQSVFGDQRRAGRGGAPGRLGFGVIAHSLR